MKSKQNIEKLKKLFGNVSSIIYTAKIFVGELLNIFKKRKLYKSIYLSAKEKNEIKEYWKKYYGKNISNKWHRLYQSYTGKFKKDYFPEIIYSTQLEPKLNNRAIASVLSDKSFLEILYKDFQNIKIPKSFLINNSGIYYSGEREILTLKDAKEKINNIGEVIIKTSLGASSGDAVELCEFSNGVDLRSNRKVNDILLKFGENFIVQEKILPCEEFKRIYPNSINTLRVITYISEGKLYHSPLSFRMGQGGNFVDNIHAGGIVIGVLDTGNLKEKAFTEMNESYQKHPDTGFEFKEFKLPKVQETIRLAKKMHEKTPHMKIISWDFTINNNYEIVLLEVNLVGQSIWFPQMVNGESMFGENTPAMIKIFK